MINSLATFQTGSQIKSSLPDTGITQTQMATILGAKHLSSYSMSSTDATTADPHFGSDEVMRAWAEKEGLTLIFDEEGYVDWSAVDAEWEK